MARIVFPDCCENISFKLTAKLTTDSGCETTGNTQLLTPQAELLQMLIHLPRQTNWGDLELGETHLTPRLKLNELD